MRTGIIFGSWDLLHAGHIHLLAECKERCDYLFVGLHTDPSIERPEKNKPIESLSERQMKLDACKYVDQILVYVTEKDLSFILNEVKPDVRFLGSDYKVFDGTMQKAITDKDTIPIEYIESLDIHTSDIRERIKGDNN